MILKRLAFATMLLGSATALTAACGSSDDEKGSKIPTGGEGGEGSGGSGGNAANSFGGTIIDPGDGDGGPNNRNPDGSCGQEAIESDTRPVNMLIVMDKSESMSEPAGTATRWDTVKLALAAAIGSTESFVDFGLSLFPYDPANPTGGDSCRMPDTSDPVVAITPGEASSVAIGDALNASAPSGGTPTATALKLALEYFTTGAGASLEGGKYVLLATDGGPNCSTSLTDCSAAECTLNLDGSCPDGVPNCCGTVAPESCLDTQDAVDAVAALRTNGIETFVVGMAIEQAEYQATLNALADAGGQAQSGDPRYYSVSDAGGVDALTTTFESITQELITSCVLELQNVPSNYDPVRVNVEIDGETIPYDQNAESGGGWKYPNAPDGGTGLDTNTIEILGTDCEKLEAEGAEAVQIVFGCERVEIR